MKKLLKISTLFILSLIMLSSGCDDRQPVSTSGVSKHKVKVKTNSNGVTVEQENVSKRLLRDNALGSVKHLYLISPMSGQVVLYSTVKGKVTSGGKRLSPKTVSTSDMSGVRVDIGGRIRRTGEVIQDDGTYGNSMDYLYWFDTNDIYHQIYTGSSIIIIREQPMPVTEISINLNNK